MNTDIEYLKLLERDLEDAAVRDASWREGAAGPPGGRRSGRGWSRVTGFAAVFLVLAGIIGFLGQGTSDSNKFSQVGSAVNGAGGGDSDGAAAPEQVAPPAPADDDVGISEEDSPGEHSFGYVGGGQRPAQTPRDLSKIVRDGRIGVTVADGTFAEAVDQVTLIAERSGGFILSSSTQNERAGTFVLRIPAGRFDRARAELRQLGDVRFEEVQGDDVTAEFIDYQTRLSVLEQRRALLRGLLDDATTTDEILRLSSMVEDVQLRIEGIQGQLRFLNDQVAEATLRVSVQERNAPNTEPRRSVDNPNLGSAWDLAIQGTLRIVSAVIVGLGYLLPLTILAALVWLGVVLLRRRRDI